MASWGSSADFFENMGRGLQEFAGVNRTIINADFEMQVRPGGTACAANGPNGLARLHDLPDLCIKARHVRIACHQAIAMDNFDRVAIARAPANKADTTLCSGINRRPCRPTKIEARMHGTLPGKGIVAIAKSG